MHWQHNVGIKFFKGLDGVIYIIVSGSSKMEPSHHRMDFIDIGDGFCGVYSIYNSSVTAGGNDH